MCPFHSIDMVSPPGPLHNVGTILDDRLHHLGCAPLPGLGHRLLCDSLDLLAREPAC